MALAGLLSFCLFLNLQDVSIFGDSKVMVDYVLGKNNILKPQLVGWLDRIRFLWNRTKGGSIHHINRALNQQADVFLKRVFRRFQVSGICRLLMRGKSFPFRNSLLLISSSPLQIL